MRIFDTVYFVFEQCYLIIILYFVVFFNWCTWTLTFCSNHCQGPWAKVARRCHGLLLTAGVGNTQPGEEKTSCHIFSVDSFANSDCGPLHWSCIAVHWKKGRKESIPIFCSLWFSSIAKPVTVSRFLQIHHLLSPNPCHLLNLCVICNI